MTQRAAVIYARISVSTEESVSVQRQLSSARKYASARGWRVVGEYVDDGVSATRNKPEERPAWRSLLNAPVMFEAVVVWKVDRLARRVIDFLHADETLQARGAAIVAVDQAIDMTTGEGRAFAQMLAVFGEMEASATSARILAARAHLISVGRVPGGRQPYGWRSVPHPSGAGYVRDQDPERIEWVRGMAERVLRGDTVYSVKQWLNALEAPPPRGRPPRPWGYTSVDVLLRNPVLAGMFPVNAHGSRYSWGPDGPDVRRGENGEPILAADGIITVEQYRTLLDNLTHKAHHTAVVRANRRTSTPLFATLATCAHCGRHMYRTRVHSKPALFCSPCSQTVTVEPLAVYVIGRLLTERGTHRMYRRSLEARGDPAAAERLATLDNALRTAALSLTEDRSEADIHQLHQEVSRIKKARLKARKLANASGAVERMTYVGTVQQVWELCADDNQRHDVLAGQLETFVISKAPHRSGGFSKKRVNLTWSTNRHPLVPGSISVGPISRRMKPPHPWISIREAATLPGSSDAIIRRAVALGQIHRREVNRMYPSLERASVEALLRDRTRLLIRQATPPGSARRISETEVDQAVRMYEAGDSLMTIGQSLGWSNVTIRRRLLARGVTMRNPNDWNARR